MFIIIVTLRGSQELFLALHSEFFLVDLEVPYWIEPRSVAFKSARQTLYLQYYQPSAPKKTFNAKE